MHAVFLTEGGPNIGLGHIMRCIALAEGISQKGGSIRFAVRGLERLKVFLTNFDVSFFDWEHNELMTRDFLKDVTLCIVDSYSCSNKFCNQVSTIVDQILFFDDYFRLKYPSNSYILNPGAKPDRNKYHLFGLDYVILRSAFWEFYKKRIRKKIRKILISFGGEDQYNLIPRVLSILKKLLKEFDVFIVNSNKETLKDVRFCDTIRIKTFHNLNATKMRNLMIESDLAISAGGQTLFELACTGTPTICIITANNQINNVRALKRCTSLQAINFDNQDFESLLKKHINSLLHQDMRTILSNQLQKAVNGQGVIKVVEKILKLS